MKDKDGKNTLTGEAQAKAVYASIEEWSIIILYLACCHHIVELMAKNPFHSIMGYNPSPDVQMFKRIKEIWNDIDKTEPLITFELETKQREELIITYTEILTKHRVDGKLFVHGDYKIWLRPD